MFRSDAYGGALLRTTSYGATATSGSAVVRRVGVVATTCATCGSVAVLIAGRQVGTLSLVSSVTRRQQVLLLPSFSLRSGAVSVRVISNGRHVELDGVVLSRT